MSGMQAMSIPFHKSRLSLSTKRKQKKPVEGQANPEIYGEAKIQPVAVVLGSRRQIGIQHSEIKKIAPQDSNQHLPMATDHGLSRISGGVATAL